MIETQSGWREAGRPRHEPGSNRRTTVATKGEALRYIATTQTAYKDSKHLDLRFKSLKSDILPDYRESPNYTTFNLHISVFYLDLERN